MTTLTPDMDLSTMSRYESPIIPTLFPHLSIGLLSLGLFFSAWFFVYEVSSSERNHVTTRARLSTYFLKTKVTSTKLTRELTKELVLASVASVFMGFGTLFLLLWTGIYV